MIAWLLTRLCSHFEQIDTASLFFLAHLQRPTDLGGAPLRWPTFSHGISSLSVSICMKHINSRRNKKKSTTRSDVTAVSARLLSFQLDNFLITPPRLLSLHA